MTTQTISKNLLLCSLFFATSIYPDTLLDSDTLLVSEATEAQPIYPAEVAFCNEKQNNIKVDYKSYKTPFEQFLDAVKEDPSLSNADLETPYQRIKVISGHEKESVSSNGMRNFISFQSYYPHCTQIPSKYSFALNKKLHENNNDLLIPAVFVYMREAGKSKIIISTQEHGFWKCSYGNCWKMTEAELLEAFEATKNPRVQEPRIQESRVQEPADAKNE